MGRRKLTEPARRRKPPQSNILQSRVPRNRTSPSDGPVPVLHVIDLAGPGGAQRVLVDLCANLDRTRWRPVVAVPAEGWITEQLRRHAIEFIIAPVRHAPFDWRYVRALTRAIRGSGARVVHAHLLGPAIYAGLAAIVTRVPMIATFHGQSDISPTERFRSAKTWIINRAAAATVYVSAALRSHFLDVTGLDPSAAHVIHNGVDLDVAVPGDRGLLRGPLGVGADQVLVGAVGHIRPPKDYPTFVRAAAILAQGSDRYRFVVVGGVDDPEVFADLKSASAASGLDGRLHFAGFRDDVPALMRDLDVYVISSVTEGLSISTIEALDAGVPTVATRCGGPEEILEHQRTGLLVDVGDAEGIARAVAQLVDDPETARRMADAGRAVVRSRFRLETMIERYDALYRAALGDAEVSRPSGDAPTG